MNGNQNYKGIQNTVVSQTTVNPVLEENLAVEEYGLYSNDSFVYSHPVVFTSNTALLTPEQVLRAKNMADTLGLLVSNTVLTADGYMVLPVADTADGATTLLNLLGINGQHGKQCLLKFSLFGVYNGTDSGAITNYEIYLRNTSSTTGSVKFADGSQATFGPECLIFGKNAVGPYSYVVATNITETTPAGVVIPRIEFRTVVYSVCCSTNGNEPGPVEPLPEL
jgi:hypothetical protein